MRAAMARTPIQASSRPGTDAFGRSIRASILPGRSAEDVYDRDREGVFAVLPQVFPAAASELAKCYLDAKKSVVREGGNSSTEERRKKVGLVDKITRKSPAPSGKGSKKAVLF